MEKSKVYFTNLRTTFDCNLLQKLKKLITAAGIGKIDFTNKYALWRAGEPGLPAAQLRQGGGRHREGAGRQALPHRLQHPVRGRPQKRPGPPGRRL